MSELYFLRHAERIDHAQSNSIALTPTYEEYDPSLSANAIPQIEQVVNDITSTSTAFPTTPTIRNKTIYIHFSPYLRCCQTADLLVTHLKHRLSHDDRYAKYNVKFQLLGDFALSEWIHEKMSNKPPFTDSDDAYAMYTANLKQLVNKSCCSNFRPATKLGPYNGPGLKYKDYQLNCKEYFTKLLATYDKPMYIKNQDIIIIISHGYAINNFMTYFTNHPIFQEIPVAKINFAQRLLSDGKSEDGTYKTDNYKWKLLKDALEIMEEHHEYALNLDTNVVYYKTNFIRKDKLKWNGSEPELAVSNLPRLGFKNDAKSLDSDSLLTPAAKNWIPGVKIYLIKREFKEKYMNDESFKRDYDISNPPTRRVTPEVSPQSAPSRVNSYIDISRLLNNENLSKPLKLKYGSNQDIPSSALNSKVNSQVNLMDYSASGYASGTSSNSSIDKMLFSLQHKSSKTATNAPEEYFPQVKSPLQAALPDIPIEDIQGRNSPIEVLSRARSGIYKQSILAQQSSNSLTEEYDDGSDKRHFTLEFSPTRTPSTNQRHATPSSNTSTPRQTRSRKNSIKFIPSGVATTSSMNRSTEHISKVKPIFYNLASDNDDDDEEMSLDESTSSSTNNNSGQYYWLGQNR
ncbi:uncharacterized protein SPAPADRAFT_156110 [Spathaspora passalidarum NRRL Y-27907]|uniref:Phosphoglycerate mutase-like protein n=1 Tax=Spathaspora passalidarum (strain NRRL Y-27907 / 11-Y1) TaxID=619300 RepID=G3AT58_SPAPN|nr:uncharacterized protein SPAPADRAFT_156110 [Spathaspora passalidarum NRRL Y-27907]EGW30821.1 hypothetical protein SPAPADRAFT_156110 [Spathaspora passalidarum NRRL Y-27907]